ncbi:putative multidrug resistance protein [Caenibius tardaugens NBRC 16725]|uniref:Efflux pump membrane transporter n=1 Tax=Caenibius tardaugens NBRC 16725 TaxID=1219035 RepID=U2YI71_9SPHN|nr:multidrug efflux RND transporter permease subunit [Caenibius tardaugens]AZI37027.1 multidrug efflux RND transporter permease subunit [Caenibius tardaugens NBRC 16725]GAD47747.1 putative multidrug resistance protein [Caenibius tardaugens NBRC 16725]
MSRIFVDRPIFAWVIAIIVMLAGLGALRALAIDQYPDIAPPQVNIRATYPGASAETVENSVTQVLEQQLTGLDGLLYFSSQSAATGSVSISVVFAKGTDPDIAQVQVQNKIQSAIARLPQSVQNQGVRVSKSNPDALMLLAIYDQSNQRDDREISDYLASNVQDPLSRIDGVGEVDVFGSPHAMRIWLNPHRLAAMNLMPADVISAIESQNVQVAAGQIGALPSPQGQMLNATVNAQGQLQTPEQFEQIVVKTLPDGSVVRIRDLARVEIGAENYNTLRRLNGHPAAGLSISLAPGADALKTAELIKAQMKELDPDFPDGMVYSFARDNTEFIKLSVEEVGKTLAEAVVLVVLVIFIFLQSWRATLIPAIAVPVVLLGTLVVFYFAGFSINTLTMFGLVLAIGLLVDDAIVVVENVERLLHENPGMSARDATLQSMKEIQVALIAIALVLSAVFLPMSFFGGSTGVIYKQFSLTIISAMVLSVLVALILSPALTATLLRPKKPRDADGAQGSWLERRFPKAADNAHWAKDRFNQGFNNFVERYRQFVAKVIDRKWLALGIYAVLVAIMGTLFLRMPGGFLPNEDQGLIMVQYRLPSGATRERTIEVQETIQNYFKTNEKANVQEIFMLVGGGGGGPTGQNSGQGFIKLAPWEDRKGSDNSADAIVERASKAFRSIRDAQVFTLIPGSIRGLGNSSGFTMQFQNANGIPRNTFADARDKLVAAANADSRLTGVRLSNLPDVSELNISVDTRKAAALGVTQNNINSTIATAWGGSYVNDFIDRGRVKRVYVMGDAPYRSRPENLGDWYVRNNTGSMTPFSAFSQVAWGTTPSSTSRFNGLSNYEIQGQPAPGVSSGEAMQIMQELAAEYPGTSVAWSGASFEERQSSGQAPLLYGLSLLVVFLCLAALYESWSIPIAAILVIPLGLVGAIFAATLRGLENDVFMQIGLLTTMGLATKNAILIIEFAEAAEKKGMRIIDAALEGARLRIRPILMTSLAFGFGVLPLALATGAGANSRIAIGTSVVGGMLTATALAVFYIPLFFVLVRRGVRDGIKAARRRLSPDDKPVSGEGAEA